jgi:hypothetical protein
MSKRKRSSEPPILRGAAEPLIMREQPPAIDPNDVAAVLARLVERVDALNGEVKRLRLRLAEDDRYRHELEERDNDGLKVGDFACNRCGSPAEYVLCEHCVRMTAARMEHAREEEAKGKAKATR